jgi:hypothetical protein
MLAILFVLMLLVSAAAGVGWVVIVRVGRHLRGNPDGVKAVVEHVVLPVFGAREHDSEIKADTGSGQQEGRDAAR